MLLIGVIGLAIMRNLLKEIGKFLQRQMGGNTGGQPAAARARGGTLVQDPQTGTYVDPANAVSAKVRGTVHYFESEASRDAYLKANG